MLNRFRNLVKRLELPAEEPEDDRVYRIIDSEFNAVEVSPAQYGIWRMQNDVAEMAIVGQETVGDFTVRTTFSIMPEHRGYKPFGTSVYEMPHFDPRTEFSRRYDTWQEAEHGHREMLARLALLSNDATSEDSQEYTGVAGEIWEGLQRGLAPLFVIAPGPGDDVEVRTPIRLPNGMWLELLVRKHGDKFVVAYPMERIELVGYRNLLSAMDDEMGRDMLEGNTFLFEELAVVSAAGGELVAEAESAEQLPAAIMALSQVIVHCSLWSVD